MMIGYVSDERYVAVADVLLEYVDAEGRVVDADHSALAGTGLLAGDLFGERCLRTRCPGRTAGHETDKQSATLPVDSHCVAHHHERPGALPCPRARQRRRLKP